MSGEKWITVAYLSLLAVFTAAWLFSIWRYPVGSSGNTSKTVAKKESAPPEGEAR